MSNNTNTNGNNNEEIKGIPLSEVTQGDVERALDAQFEAYCEMQQEEANNQSKEDNNMNSKNLTNEPNIQNLYFPGVDKCTCITASGSPCKSHPHYLVVVEYRTTTAYQRGSAPLTTQGANFGWAQIAVCPSHKNMLEEGKAVKIPVLDNKSGVVFHNNKEDITMVEHGDPFANFNPNTSSKEDDMKNQPSAKDVIIQAFNDGTKAWVRHTLHECDPEECTGTHDEQWWAKRKERNAEGAQPGYVDEDFDREHSKPNQFKLLEGRSFDTHHKPYMGNFMVERCDHAECHANFAEIMVTGEECCGEEKCNHWYTILCEHHTPKVHVLGAMRMQFVQPFNMKIGDEWVPVPGRYREWHKTQQHVRAHIEHLRNTEGIDMQFTKTKKANNGHGFWVIWNADQAKVDEFRREHNLNVRPPMQAQAKRPTIALNDDRVITVKCGWGKDAHDWTATRGEIKSAGGKCPEHRTNS